MCLFYHFINIMEPCIMNSELEVHGVDTKMHHKMLISKYFINLYWIFCFSWWCMDIMEFIWAMWHNLWRRNARADTHMYRSRTGKRGHGLYGRCLGDTTMWLATLSRWVAVAWLITTQWQEQMAWLILNEHNSILFVDHFRVLKLRKLRQCVSLVLFCFVR